MKPRKMTTVRYKTPGAIKIIQESRKYYAQITLPNGKRKSVPLATDFTRSKQMLTKIEGNVIDDEHGTGDPDRVHNSRSLAAHLDD